jgi:hypothetical protein
MRLRQLSQRLAIDAVGAYRRTSTAMRNLTALLWLRLIRMPQLHMSLGKRLAAAAKLPPSLAERKQTVSQLQEALAAGRKAPQAAPASDSNPLPNTLLFRCVAFGRACFISLRLLPTQLWLANAYRALGRESLLTYGKRSVPPELMGVFNAALIQQRDLQVWLESFLASVKPRTPVSKTMAASTLGALALGVIFISLRTTTSKPLVADARANAWQAEARSDEPLASFRFDDLQRQSASRDSPWRIESDSGLNDYAHQIDRAIAEALGKVSSTFRGREFRGVSLCIPFQKMKVSDWNYPTYMSYPFLLQLPNPKDEEKRMDPWESDTRLAIDSATGRVVSVMVIMRSTSIGVIQDKLIEMFGRTPQDIEQGIFHGGDYIKKWSVVKYTFPETLVRVVAGTNVPLRNGYSEDNIEIWVLDRSFVERNVRAYANAFISACRWMDQARSLYDASRGVSVSLMPKLVDTTTLVDEAKQFAVCVDPALEKEADRIAAINEKSKLAQELVPSVDRLVGGVGNYEDGSCVIVARPQVPLTNGTDRLWTPEVAISPYGIDDCCVFDVYWHVASALAQAQFPPRGESISVIDPQKTNYSAQWTSSQPIANQVTGAYQATKCKRHEWVDRNGWVVSVAADGSISLLKPSAEGP